MTKVIQVRIEEQEETQWYGNSLVASLKDTGYRRRRRDNHRLPAQSNPNRRSSADHSSTNCGQAGCHDRSSRHVCADRGRGGRRLH